MIVLKSKLDILELIDEEQKKRILGGFNGSFLEILYKRAIYFKLTLDILEFLMNSKKILGVFSGSFLRNIVEGGHRFLNFFKGGHLKIVCETLV